MGTDWISAGSNVITTAIWLIYLQLFYFSYRRANRPFSIIHQAQGSGLKACCLFVNMSKEPIHVQSVVAKVKTASGLSTGFVTDYARHSPEDKSVANNLREGPIQPGGYLVLGSFEDILQSAVGTDQSPPQTQKDALEHAKRLQICIAATHGPSQHLIGARRSFDISRNGEAGHLQAQSIYTEQLTSKRKRREVRQWVQERLQPRYDSENQDRDSEQRV